MAMGVVSAVIGGIITVSGAGEPTTAPVAIDARLEAKPKPKVTATRAKARTLSAPVPKPTPTPRPKASASRPPRPAGGLNQAQMNNAAVIVRAAQDRGLPRRAMLVAMMTGLQETRLRNLANPSVPESLDLANEGSGQNFDSLGVFQQRPSQGWGTVEQLMDPRYAADAFYARLLRVSDWESKDLGDAAQAVQRSGAPDAYDKHEEQATTVVDALL